MQPEHVDEIASLKIPPHSIEGEMSVLGSAFLSKAAIDEVQFLTADDFYRKEHRVIFQAIIDLYNDNKETDIVTVAEWLENHNLLDEAGGMRNLAALAENTPSASNVKAYAEIVYRRSLLRKLLGVCHTVQETVFKPEGKDTIEIIDYANNEINRLTDSSAGSDIESTAAVVNSALQEIDYCFQNKGELLGLSTGLKGIDWYLNGLKKTDLIVVAGRPSMGKSAFGFNIAEYNAVEKNKTVAVFSLEMSKESLIKRAVSKRTGINLEYVLNGKFSQDDWGKITKATSAISNSKLFIDDRSAITPSQIRATARKIQRKHGLDLIMVDYLQLMRCKAESRVNEIEEISRQLKSIAKDLNVPVLALSQLNRELEKRGDKRPILSDLKGSGAIEQDADVIIFLYRDEVYNDSSPDKGIAEAIIGKQRNGKIGKTKLCFQGEFVRFENLLA